jgi:hypothetical protein
MIYNKCGVDCNDPSSGCMYTDMIKYGRKANFVFKYISKEEGRYISPAGIK